MQASNLVNGAIATLAVGSISGFLILGKPVAGVLPGLLAGLWVWWLSSRSVARANFLSPLPRRYDRHVDEVYDAVKESLSNTTFGQMKDKWTLKSDNRRSRKLKASIEFSDKSHNVPFGSSRTRRKKFVERELTLRATVTSEESVGDSASVLTLEFHPEQEVPGLGSTDELILDFEENLESLLGASEELEVPLRRTPQAPPWWLLIASACVLVLFILDANSQVKGG